MRKMQPAHTRSHTHIHIHTNIQLQRIPAFNSCPQTVETPSLLTNHATKKNIYMARQTIKCSARSLALAAFLKTKVSHLVRSSVALCDHAAGMLSREHRMHSE